MASDVPVLRAARARFWFASRPRPWIPSTVACGRGTAGRCTSRCSRWCSAATSAARSARGDAARAFPLGAAVFGALSPVAPRGTHAEYVAVPEAHLARVPPGWSHIDAAAVPFAALTAWRALFTTANLRPGERLLVLGAGGAVGAAATHLASARACPVAVITCAESDAPRLRRRPAPSTRGTTDPTSPRPLTRKHETGRRSMSRWIASGESRANAPRRDCFVRVSVAPWTLHGALAGEIGEKGILLGGAAAAFELARKKTLMRASEDVGYHWSVMRPDADGMAAVARLRRGRADA